MVAFEGLLQMTEVVLFTGEPQTSVTKASRQLSSGKPLLRVRCDFQPRILYSRYLLNPSKDKTFHFPLPNNRGRAAEPPPLFTITQTPRMCLNNTLAGSCEGLEVGFIYIGEILEILVLRMHGTWWGACGGRYAGFYTRFPGRPCVVLPAFPQRQLAVKERLFT